MNTRNRLQRRRTALSTIDELFRQPSIVNCIHYSSEGFFDKQDGRSARITSIAVRNLASGHTDSFSIHLVAERSGIDIQGIEGQYDRLEKKMLDEFFEFVLYHSNFFWIHWNMRDVNFGFPAIEHRYRVLGGNPVLIPEARRVDLSVALYSIYGRGYIGHPRLQQLVEQNSITSIDFLSGADEAAAFASRSYVRLHQSTLRKVDIISNIAYRTWDGTLKTNAKWRDVYGSTIAGFVEAVSDHWFYKVLGFIGILASLIGVLLVFVM
jgi:hypothetical protein